MHVTRLPAHDVTPAPIDSPSLLRIIVAGSFQPVPHGGVASWPAQMLASLAGDAILATGRYERSTR